MNLHLRLAAVALISAATAFSCAPTEPAAAPKGERLDAAKAIDDELSRVMVLYVEGSLETASARLAIVEESIARCSESGELQAADSARFGSEARSLRKLIDSAFAAGDKSPRASAPPPARLSPPPPPAGTPAGSDGEQTPLKRPNEGIPPLIDKGPPAAPRPPEEKTRAVNELRAARMLLDAGEPAGAEDRLRLAEAAISALRSKGDAQEADAAKLSSDAEKLRASVEAALKGRPKAAATTEPLKVEAIIYSDARRSALVNGCIVKEGDTLDGGAKVVRIERDSVVFLSGGAEVAIPVGGGTGSEPKAAPKQPKPKAKPDDSGAAPLAVSAIVVSADKRSCIVNGKLVSEGDIVSEGTKVVKIEADGVTFDVRGQTVVVKTK